jgi:DNA-binding beta-propeller fold protein YncE
MAVLVPARVLAGAALAALGLATAPAAALEVQVTGCGRSLVGEAHTFTASPTDATGTVTYEWQFGNNTEFVPGQAEMSQPFAAAGHYAVRVSAIDEGGLEVTALCQHLVHFPLTERRPTSSTPIVHDATRNRVYTVNQDSDTITSIDAEQLVKLAELPVYQRPEALAIAPDGKLWVLHKDDYAIAVVDLDSFSVTSGFRLPYASQPVGLATSPTGDAVYVTLMAVGKLLKLDPATTTVLGELDVGPRPRGLTVSHDGAQVYVSRFISPNEGGEVVQVDAAGMQVKKRIVLPIDTTTEETGLAGRGLPNYLFSVALSPDGRQAWVSGKKDNILRGQLHNQPALSFEQTVRPMVAAIDVATGTELTTLRTDLDDRSLPVHVEFSPYGDFAILTLAGSNTIEIRKTSSPAEAFVTLSDAGQFPRATVLAPNNRLFVQGSLSRNVLVYDVRAMLEKFDSGTPLVSAEIPTVEVEKLQADVLAGKRMFHDSSDDRMAKDKYISCGVCHFEGLDDGRVYDFSHRGEGMRNTMALLGRAGTKHGRLNWSGNFDEIQDFEHQLRDSFDGKGFIPDEVLQTGTRNQPLGEPKAGLSPELDALAAYVSSLEHVNPSPFRNPDGSLTADAVAGKAVFGKLGCDFCHGGPDFTDSDRGKLHDVGTITANSGMRAGQPLLGIDSPTLLGVWETPPYLHDGSAPTLRDVLTTSNPSDLHGFVTSLSPEQLDQLIAYVSQIDGDQRLRALPFEPPLPEPIAGSGGQSGATGQAGTGGQTATGGGLQGAAGGGTKEEPRRSSCACRAPGVDARSGRPWAPLTALGLSALFAVGVRRAWRQR